MRSDFIEFEFGRLHYLHSMRDMPTTILFLHAFHSSASSYESVCDLLKDQFNLVCLDFPGHGLSAHVDLEKHAWYYSAEGFTSVVIEFINRLQLKNLIVVGNSIGGISAVRAIPALSMLKGIISLGSTQVAKKEDLFELFQDADLTEMLFKKELTHKECETLALGCVDPLVNNGKNLQQVIDDIKRTDPNCREQLSFYLETQEWVNEPELIQKSGMPVMFVLGIHDKFINVINYKTLLLASGVENSQIHILDQVRHVPQLDNPALCAQLILGFAKD